MTDFVTVMGAILMNMLVLLTITAALASAGTPVAGIAGGLGALTLFNLAAYQTVPFVAGGDIVLSYSVRRLLTTLAPLRVVYAPSVSHLSTISRYIVPPYLIDEMFAWQVVFVCLALVASLVVFNRRDL